MRCRVQPKKSSGHVRTSALQAGLTAAALNTKKIKQIYCRHARCNRGEEYWARYI